MLSVYFFAKTKKGIIIEEDFIKTVKVEVRDQIKVRRSLFIGTLSPVADLSEAENYISHIQKTYYDATHNCYAFQITRDLFRYSDDGEPSGTAGRPILARIQKYDLQQVALVVTRYFGGIKLGTGGLIRAYGECAEAVIQKSKIIRKYNFKNIRIIYPFSMINKVQYLIQKYDARIQEDSTEKGMIADIRILPSRYVPFREELIQITAGKIQIS
ncbi:MAG: IMPACT family protein [Calditrichia bacterium]